MVTGPGTKVQGTVRESRCRLARPVLYTEYADVRPTGKEGIQHQDMGSQGCADEICRGSQETRARDLSGKRCVLCASPQLTQDHREIPSKRAREAV